MHGRAKHPVHKKFTRSVTTIMSSCHVIECVNDFIRVINFAYHFCFCCCCYLFVCYHTQRERAMGISKNRATIETATIIFVDLYTDQFWFCTLIRIPYLKAQNLITTNRPYIRLLEPKKKKCKTQIAREWMCCLRCFTSSLVCMCVRA